MTDGNKKGQQPEFVVLRSDRRKDLRISLLVINVTVKAGNTFFGYAKNISKGGIFISSVNPRKVGEKFTISFKLPDDGTLVTVKAQVAWVQDFNPKGGSEPGMGLKFVEIDEALEKKITAWVENKKK